VIRSSLMPNRCCLERFVYDVMFTGLDLNGWRHGRLVPLGAAER
jgi:hypothetical protein